MTSKNNSLSKGGAYYLIYNVLNVAFPFVTGIYVARKLIPESIGSVTAAQNLAQYFVILAFLGIPTYGMREIAKTRNDESERNKVFSELFVINLISTCVFLAIYIVIVCNIPAYRKELTLYLIVGASIALNACNVSWLFEGLEEFKFISVRNIIFKFLSFLLLLLFVRDKDDYLAYAAITIVGTAGNNIVNVFYCPKFVKLSVSSLNLKRHIKPIIFLASVYIAIEIYSLVDITMMNFMCEKDSIAFYRYGHNIQKMLLQIVNTFTMVLIPRISFYYKENRLEDFNKLVSKALKLIIIFSVPMIVGIYFTADFIITRIYGAQYINSAYILKLFSLLLLISPIGYLLGSRMLLATNHENKMIISVGVGAVVNIIGNYFLIPIMAEFGATLASIVSELVVMIIYIYLGKKYYRLVDMPKTVIKVLLSSIIMGIYLFLCSFIPLNEWIILVFQIVGAIIIYLSLMIVFKEPIM